MAEIELSVFGKQCLRGRIGDEETLKQHIGALERERNEAGATINWRFNSQDARVKLNRIYSEAKAMNSKNRTCHHQADLVLGPPAFAGVLGSGRTTRPCAVASMRRKRR